MDNFAEMTKDPLPGDQVGKFKYAEDDYFLYRDHLKSIVKGEELQIIVGSIPSVIKDDELSLIHI